MKFFRNISKKSLALLVIVLVIMTVMNQFDADDDKVLM